MIIMIIMIILLVQGTQLKQVLVFTVVVSSHAVRAIPRAQT